MTQNLSISVIIPAYNVESYLAEAIDSALLQTVPPAEIIVVDDGSTDGTQRVAERFESKIRYFRQPNARSGRARNRGLAEARSDWVAFLDGDDIWLPRKLQLQTEAIGRFDKPVILSSQMVYFTSTTQHRPLIHDIFQLDKMTTESLLLRNRVFTSTVIAPRKALEEFGGFDERYRGPEDYDMWLRLSTRLDIWRMPDVLAAYRIRLNSLSHNVGQMRDQEIKIIEGISASHTPKIPKRLQREARSCVHLRAAISYIESDQTDKAISESLFSLLQWPFSLSEYSPERRFMRSRVLRRAFINHFRARQATLPDRVEEQMPDRLFESAHTINSMYRLRSERERSSLDVQVSVIVPSYNYGRYLGEAIESALAQTLTQIEVIVVDDGSTDNTPEVLSRYADNPRVRYVRQENRGLSASRNLGIRLAQSEFVAFLDADDRWKPDKLARQLAQFTGNDVGLVFCGRETFDENGTVTLAPARTDDCDRVLELMTVSTVFSPSSVVARKRCFEEVGGFDEALKKVEDREMWIRIAQRYAFHCVEDCLVEIRVHDRALSRQIEGMEEAFRITLRRAFAARSLQRRFLLRCRAHAFMHYDFSWVYHAARQNGKALKHLLLSLACYPLPDTTGRLFGQPFARYRRLVRYILMPNAD